MATYLLRSQNDDGSYKNEIVEADSAVKAVEGLETDNAYIEVWTLRSKEPRTFEVVTESVRTITQT